MYFGKNLNPFTPGNFAERETPFEATILGKIKWNSKPPSPPKSRMRPREGQKRAIFPSLIWVGRGGGGGGLGFPFILSKIVSKVSRSRNSGHS